MFSKVIRPAAVALGAVLSARASAAPVICVTPGYADARCLTPIRQAPSPAPGCSSAPGWTTISPAVWQGYHWGQPQCNYQAPPTCAPNWTQTSAPVWNGANWSAPSCVAPFQPTTPQQEQQACVTLWNSTWKARFGPYPIVSASAVGQITGPIPEIGLSQYDAQVAALTAKGAYNFTLYLYGSAFGGGTQPGDNEPNDYVYIGGLMCWLHPGTTNIIGVAEYYYCTDTSATANCGGGGFGNGGGG